MHFCLGSITVTQTNGELGGGVGSWGEGGGMLALGIPMLFFKWQAPELNGKKPKSWNQLDLSSNTRPLSKPAA